MKLMTDAQKWYLYIIASQHVGSDDIADIDTFLTGRGVDPNTIDVADASRLIDDLRKTVPKIPATQHLKEEILRAARKGNLYDNTLPKAELIERVCDHYNFDWDSLLADDGCRIFDALRAKRGWTRQQAIRRLRY